MIYINNQIQPPSIRGTCNVQVMESGFIFHFFHACFTFRLGSAVVKGYIPANAQ